MIHSIRVRNNLLNPTPVEAVKKRVIYEFTEKLFQEIGGGGVYSVRFTEKTYKEFDYEPYEATDFALDIRKANSFPVYVASMVEYNVAQEKTFLQRLVYLFRPRDF